MVQRFINDVMKPWEDLNALLARPLAVQPELSGLTRQAGALAVSMCHYGEINGEDREIFVTATGDNRLICDVADAAKHGALKDSKRRNSLSVMSTFEYHATRGFRFIRNVITIEHATHGERDFMQTALAAIGYWVTRLGFSLDRELAVTEGPSEFSEAAGLIFDPHHCIQMNKCRIGFVERGANGEYRQIDPPEVKFAVLNASPGTSGPRFAGAQWFTELTSRPKAPPEQD